MSAWTARRAVAIAIAFLLLGITAYQAGRVLRAERAIIDAAGGGGMSLPLDDSFIYLQYARAIAEGHPFVYTPGNAPTTGSTSLWYPLLLVPPHLFGASPEFVIAWVFGLGVLSYFLIALLAGKLGATLGGWPGGAFATALVLASPHLLWGALSGMEIGLYGALLLATTLAYVRERGDARFPTFRWWVFLLAGARPEGAILCGVFAVFALRDAWAAGARDGERRSPMTAALCLAAAAIPFLVNLAVVGSVESTSSQAKSIFAEPYRESRASYLAGAPRIAGEVVKTYASFLLPMSKPGGGSIVPPFFGWVTGLGVLFFAIAGRLPGRRRWPATFTVLGIVGAGMLVCVVPLHWWVHYYRYLQGLFPLFLVIVAAGWGRLAYLLPARWPRAVTAAAGAVAVAIPFASAIPRMLPEQSDVILLYGHNCQNILHQQIAVGRWIDANLPKDAVVGMNDAGAIAYFGRRQTVDLVGLTSAEYARVYRSGLGCLFEHLRRQPATRLPTYFAIYPEWFPYWPESGILGPESFRAHLGFNTICGGTDMVVYPAAWLDTKPTDRPALAAGLESRELVDALDHAWLEDERRHDWRAEPEAKDVLRRYAFPDRMNRPATDGGRIVRGAERFRATVRPGRDLVLLMRTDAWYSNRLRVTVDGQTAGIWSIARSESAWAEPRFTVAGSLLRRERPEFRIERVDAAGDGNAAPFRYWFFQ